VAAGSLVRAERCTGLPVEPVIALLAYLDEALERDSPR
jgi:hypothetical protein